MKSSSSSKGGSSLSVASPYEQTFKTRHRKVGRPTGDVEPLFGTVLAGREVDPVIALVAKRRAYAVVQEEQRDRLRSVFEAELKVLARRGLSVVARDAGVKLKAMGVKDEDIVSASAAVVELMEGSVRDHG